MTARNGHTYLWGWSNLKAQRYCWCSGNYRRMRASSAVFHRPLEHPITPGPHQAMRTASMLGWCCPSSTPCAEMTDKSATIRMAQKVHLRRCVMLCAGSIAARELPAIRYLQAIAIFFRPSSRAGLSAQAGSQPLVRLPKAGLPTPIKPDSCGFQDGAAKRHCFPIRFFARFLRIHVINLFGGGRPAVPTSGRLLATLIELAMKAVLTDDGASFSRATSLCTSRLDGRDGAWFTSPPVR